MRMADRYWGERSALAYALRTQQQDGACLAFGSDAPVESPNPFWGIHAAVTRQRQDGAPGKLGWYPSQRLSVLEALQGFTIGVPEEYFPDDLDAGVRAGCGRAIARMRDAGATISPVSLPHTGLAIPTYYILAPAEASSNLARYDGVRYGPRYAPPEGDVQAMYRATRGVGFGPEVRRRIIVGTYVLSAGYYDAYYRKALRARWLIARDFDRVFAGGVDLLFTPSTPTTAFRAGEKLEDPIAMYLADVFSCPANLAWVTAMSMPVGRAGGLPIGGQFIGPQFGEARMLQAASVLERLVDPAAEAR